MSKRNEAPTPGPWGVSSLFIVCDSEAHVLANCGHLGIPELDVPFNERVANARLMASAPELRQALRDAVAALGGIRSGTVPDSVRHALKKAEGQ